jgi:DNA-binding MarR family transcriptional regulator
MEISYREISMLICGTALTYVFIKSRNELSEYVFEGLTDKMSISSRQHEILIVLSQREQWSLGEIATAVGVSHVAITKIVDRLEHKGLVKRDVDYKDRRRVLVNLTRAGTTMLKRSLSGSTTTDALKSTRKVGPWYQSGSLIPQ